MPGSGKQSPEVQANIRKLLEAGFDPTTIHRKLKVGRSSIYRMKRCLQQHGTNYMPVELNKKNGRPKVLTSEQELEVRDWLRDPKNRNRYLDDLVWLIHDRFGIVCSTTTMSKMKRKWLRVIEYEETGNPIDEVTRAQLAETHPELAILHPQPSLHDQQVLHDQLPLHDQQSLHDQLPLHDQQSLHDQQPLLDAQLVALQPVPLDGHMQHPISPELEQELTQRLQQPQTDPHIDSRLEQRLHANLVAAATAAAAAEAHSQHVQGNSDDDVMTLRDSF